MSFPEIVASASSPFGLSLSKPVLSKDAGPFDRLRANGIS